MNLSALLGLTALTAGVISVAAQDLLTVYIAPRFVTPVWVGTAACAVLLLLAFAAARRGARWRCDAALFLLLPAALLFVTPRIDHGLLNAARFRSLAPPRVAGGRVAAPLDADGYRCLDLQQVYGELDELDDTGIAQYRYRLSTEAMVAMAPDEEGDDAVLLAAGEMVVVRMRMICCVADLQPLGLVVANRRNFDRTDYDTWLRLRGTLSFRRLPRDAGWYAYLTDDEIRPVEAPAREYLYPDYAALAARPR